MFGFKVGPTFDQMCLTPHSDVVAASHACFSASAKQILSQVTKLRLIAKLGRDDSHPLVEVSARQRRAATLRLCTRRQSLGRLLPPRYHNFIGKLTIRFSAFAAVDRYGTTINLDSFNQATTSQSQPETCTSSPRRVPRSTSSSDSSYQGDGRTYFARAAATSNLMKTRFCFHPMITLLLPLPVSFRLSRKVTTWCRSTGISLSKLRRSRAMMPC